MMRMIKNVYFAALHIFLIYKFIKGSAVFFSQKIIQSEKIVLFCFDLI